MESSRVGYSGSMQMALDGTKTPSASSGSPSAHLAASLNCLLRSSSWMHCMEKEVVDVLIFGFSHWRAGTR